MQETIAAISTGSPGGIGIIRLSGPNAWPIGKEILAWGREAPRPRLLTYGKVQGKDGKVIDECLFVLMRGPHSYTGEDLLELHCHGGTVVLGQVLDRCLEVGAVLAQPGEFTQRAFLNGKLDLTQAEAIGDLIDAKTPKAASVAVSQLEGSLSRKLGALRGRLLDSLSQIEGRMDFPDEIGDDLPPDFWKELEEINDEIEALIAGGHRGQILREGLPVTIAGKPNVGKSSLLNSLLGTQRAIVTCHPGTTRDVIQETANFGGIPVVLSDTAGVREAKDPVEQLGVDLALRTSEEAALVLLVLDGSEPLEEADRKLLKNSDPAKTFVVINKSDLPQKFDSKALSLPPSIPIFSLSAREGYGLDELKGAIAKRGMAGGSEDPALLVNARQREALYHAKKALLDALASHREGWTLDLIALDLRLAIEKLGEITGENLIEGLLERIFSNFCLGK